MLDAPLIVVSTGKIVSGLIFIFSSNEYGTTVSCAPVSHIEGLAADLPGLCDACLYLGRLRPSSAYPRLSRENCVVIRGLFFGLVLSHPRTVS